MQLSLNEIKTWQKFEDLVSGYFIQVKDDQEFDVSNVIVSPSGEGADGGRDILVEMTTNDSIRSFVRKWVVQCKFYTQSVGKKHLSDINIPSILHEYGADGYLLVCKNGVTKQVSDMFEGFNKNCWANRSYQIWSGSELLRRLILKNDLLKVYFPRYSKFLNSVSKMKKRRDLI